MIINNIANINFGGGGGESAKLQEKSMTLSSATATIVPDEGYDGMTKVGVDATDYGQSKYDEGIAAVPLERGAYFSYMENGRYNIKPGQIYSGISDGILIIDVDIPNVQTIKTMTVTANTEDGKAPYFIYADDGYNAMEELVLTVNVPTSSKMEVPNGVKFGCSKEFDGNNYSVDNVSDFNSMFRYSEMSAITGIDTWNYASGTDFSYMFADSKVKEMNMSGFTFPQINKTFVGMFSDCSNLTSVKFPAMTFGSVEIWNTFFNCNNLTSVDMSQWNTINVTRFESMFNSSAMTVLDISSWDTTNCYLFQPFRNLDNLTNLIVSYKLFLSNEITSYNFWALPKWEGSVNTLQDALLDDRVTGTGKKILLCQKTYDVIPDSQKTLIENKGWTFQVKSETT